MRDACICSLLQLSWWCRGGVVVVSWCRGGVVVVSSWCRCRRHRCHCRVVSLASGVSLVSLCLQLRLRGCCWFVVGGGALSTNKRTSQRTLRCTPKLFRPYTSCTYILSTHARVHWLATRQLFSGRTAQLLSPLLLQNVRCTRAECAMDAGLYIMHGECTLQCTLQPWLRSWSVAVPQCRIGALIALSHVRAKKME